MKRLLAFVVLLAPLAIAGEPEVLADDWQVVKMFGQESGWAHTRVVRKGDVIETTVDTEIVMKRADAEVKMTSTETTEERADDGAILRIRSSRNMSNMVMESDIRFEGTKAIMVTKVAGQAREAKQEVGAVVGPYRIEQLTRETGLKQGATVATRTYMSDVGGAIDVTITIGGEEEIELLDGKKAKGVRVDSVMKQLGMKPTSWADAAGKLLKMKMNVGGMDMESVTATEERARKGASTPPAALPDSFANSLLAPLHQIPYPRRVDRATYRVRAKDEMPDFADGRQTVEKDGDAVLLRVERQVPAAGAATRPIKDPPAELAPCLAASSSVQSDEPEIMELAKEIVGSETDAWKAALRIERWVYENVTEKSYGVGFASALEVCRDRKGDCTEHAVLLCAFARAAGIPSRVTMGFTCIGNAFGGHAWNEVWIGGKWYALDGTLGQGSADATHITFTRMTMEDAAGPEAYAGLLKGLGNLEIDPIEVVIGGRTLRPAEVAMRITGNRFESKLWGIAFTGPEGFTLETPENKAAMTARIAGFEGKTANGTRCAIEIEATDAGVWDDILSVASQAFDSSEETTVDGRAALRVRKDARRGAFVKTEFGVFTVSMEPVEGDADAAVLDALLSSLDFDVK